MGFGGISIWQLLIVLAIIVLLFGTKRLRTFGSDLGSAVKGFRKSLNDAETERDDQPKLEEDDDSNVIDGNLEKTEEKDKSSS